MLNHVEPLTSGKPGKVYLLIHCTMDDEVILLRHNGVRVMVSTYVDSLLFIHVHADVVSDMYVLVFLVDLYVHELLVERV